MSVKNKIWFNSISSAADDKVLWNLSDVIFTYAFMFTFSLIFIGILLHFSLDINMGIFAALLQIALSCSTLGMIYYIVTIKYKTSFSDAFGIYFDKIKYFSRQGLWAAAAIILSTYVISTIFSATGAVSKENPYISMTEDKLRAVVFLAVFIAPFIEEIFFRGFMQSALIKTFGAMPGILLTALIFGVSHTQYFDYNSALFAVTAIGLILGITKYYTGSVIPGMFAHLFNNLIASLSILSLK